MWSAHRGSDVQTWHLTSERETAAFGTMSSLTHDALQQLELRQNGAVIDVASLTTTKKGLILLFANAMDRAHQNVAHKVKTWCAANQEKTECAVIVIPVATALEPSFNPMSPSRSDWILASAKPEHANATTALYEKTFMSKSTSAIVVLDAKGRPTTFSVNSLVKDTLGSSFPKYELSILHEEEDAKEAAEREEAAPSDAGAKASIDDGSVEDPGSAAAGDPAEKPEAVDRKGKSKRSPGSTCCVVM